MRIARALSTALGMLLLLTIPAAALDEESLERCGTEDESFVCDMIHVNFLQGVDVAEVIRNHGGNPETDIIQETAVSNGRIIAVERGTQIETVADYIADPLNVRYAELLPWRSEYGPGELPNTALPPSGGSLLALTAGLLVVTALYGMLHVRLVSRQ